MKSALCHLIAVCTALVFITPASAEPEITLKLHHFLSPQSSEHAHMLVPFAERVEKDSKGRLKIEIYPNMALGGKPPQLIRQLRDGVVDMILAVNAYTPGLFPRSEVFELPFIYINDPVATNLAMRDLFASHLAEDYQGIKVLALHVPGGFGLQMIDTPVYSVDDLSGKKLRTPSRVGSWILEALNARAVETPLTELRQLLSRKVVDGALVPWELIPPLNLQELTDYQIEGKDSVRFGNVVLQVSMNEDSWQKLPPDLQQILTDNTGEAWRREIGELSNRAETAGLNVALEAGNTHIVLGAEEMAQFRQKLNPVVERWIAEVAKKGIDGRALVDAARAAVARHSQK